MTGLTPFLVAMIRTPDDRLAKADVGKLAAKYGIRDDWAGFYLNTWLGRAA